MPDLGVGSGGLGAGGGGGGASVGAGLLGITKPASVGMVGDSLVVQAVPAYDIFNGVATPPNATTINVAYTTGIKTRTLRDFLLHASMRSNGGYFPFEFNGCCSGATTDQIVGIASGWAGFSPLDVMLGNPYGLPNALLIFGGTNDWGSAISPQTSVQNLAAGFKKAKAAGCVPLAMTIPPINANALAVTGTVSGISQASQAVVTLNNASAANPFAGLASCPAYVSGASGMTQINNRVVKIVALGGSSGAWTVTLNINSTAFTAWSSGGTLTLYPRQTWTRIFNRQLVRYCKDNGIPCPDVYSALVDPASGRWRTTAALTITAISQAASAVVTVNTVSTANPMSLGGGIYFSGVVGMTQINGQTGTITSLGGSSGAWTATVSINSTSFTAYSSGGVANYTNLTFDGIHMAACGAATMGDPVNQTYAGYFGAGAPLVIGSFDDAVTPSDPTDGYGIVRTNDPNFLGVTGTANSTSSYPTAWVPPTTLGMSTLFTPAGNEPGGGHTPQRGSAPVAGQPEALLGNAWFVQGDGAHNTGSMGWNVSPFVITQVTGNKIVVAFRMKNIPSNAISANQDDFFIGGVNGGNGHKLAGIVGPGANSSFDTCQIGGEPGYDAGQVYLEYTMVAAETSFGPTWSMQTTSGSSSNVGHALGWANPEFANATTEGIV